MVRDPDLGAEARFKKLPPLSHEAAYQRARTLEQQGKLQGKTFAQGNPYAVQLAAAAPWEEAAEYPDRYGEYRGLFTTALTQAIRDASGQEVSWKTVMAYVTELVHARCSRQRPWIGGPHTRFLFSLDGRDSGVLPVKLNDSTAIIQAGRVGGVRVDNVYAIMPPGSERAETHRQIAQAIVTRVEAFQAFAKLEFNETKTETTAPVPADGLALGFITTEALHKWPVRCPELLAGLREAIERSRFLKIVENDNESPLIEFCLEGGALTMRNSSRMLVGLRTLANAEPTTSDIVHVLRGAEIFARARHFLTIQSTENESLDAHVLSAFQTNVYLVENGTRKRLIQSTGEDTITEQQRISIQLKNDSDFRLYVSVFSIEVTGWIGMLADRRQVPPMKDELIGHRGNEGAGMRVLWPDDDFLHDQPVVETLVFVISDAPVDLRYLATPNDGQYREHRKTEGGSSRSRLDEAVQSLAYGHRRRVEGSDGDYAPTRWHIRQAQFLLQPKVQAIRQFCVSLFLFIYISLFVTD
jgi:hypothetical protein